MPPVTPALSPSLSDAEYTVLARTGKCALCKRPGADAATLIVPLAYGGEPTVDNLWPVHLRCGELRHQILGTSPEPPNAEDLARLSAIPERASFVRGLLRAAATEHLRQPSYGSVDSITLMERRIEANVGYGLTNHTRPDNISEEDWTWLQTSDAFDAIHEACWALLKSDG
jgi:hypothetical protein